MIPRRQIAEEIVPILKRNYKGEFEIHDFDDSVHVDGPIATNNGSRVAYLRITIINENEIYTGFSYILDVTHTKQVAPFCEDFVNRYANNYPYAKIITKPLKGNGIMFYLFKKLTKPAFSAGVKAYLAVELLETLFYDEKIQNAHKKLLEAMKASQI